MWSCELLAKLYNLSLTSLCQNTVGWEVQPPHYKK